MWKETDDKLAMVILIREAIRNSGLSITELSRRSGVSHPQISRFLSKERTMTLPAAAKVCECLGLELIQRKRPTAGQTPPRSSSSPGPVKKRSRGKKEKVK